MFSEEYGSTDIALQQNLSSGSQTELQTNR